MAYFALRSLKWPISGISIQFRDDFGKTTPYKSLNSQFNELYLTQGNLGKVSWLKLGPYQSENFMKLAIFIPSQNWIEILSTDAKYSLLYDS